MTDQLLSPFEVDDSFPIPNLAKRLDHELREASSLMEAEEVRYMVDLYYDIQKPRVGVGNRLSKVERTAKAALESGESPPPTPAVLQAFFNEQKALEERIRKALDTWTAGKPLGVWARSTIGIGPVIAAGLMSHIDPRQTVGQVWSFAGLNPDMVWEKGQRRPYNATLRMLTAYKVGESFVKVSGNPKSLYGQIFKERKKYEEERNDSFDEDYREAWEEAIAAFMEYKAKKDKTARDRDHISGVLINAGMAAGHNSGRAAQTLLSSRCPNSSTDAWGALIQGRLPQAQIHAQARRYAVKIFLSHYFAAAYILKNGTMPSLPWIITYGGHQDYIEPEVPFPAVA